MGVIAVADHPIVPLVPPRQTLSRTGQDRAEPGRFPLPALVGHEAVGASLVCGVGSVDARGRVSDRAVVRRLGWQIGTRLQLRIVSGSVIIHARDDGLFTLTGQGYVRLPAPARHRCALHGGDKVLLAAEPQQNTLVIHTMPTVAAAFRELHERLWTGDAG